jgi:hypothetical protein
MKTANNRFVCASGALLIILSALAFTLSIVSILEGIRFMVRNDYGIPFDLAAGAIGVIGSSAVLMFGRQLFRGEDKKRRHVWPLYFIGCIIGILIVFFSR